MAGNMESLLLGGDDDSSDDSDTETLQEVTAGTAVPAAAAVAATIQPIQQPAPVPAPAPVPPAPQRATGAPTTQSELSSRLKSLYSPANKTPQAAAPAMTQPKQNRPEQQKQTQPSSSSGFRPLVPNAPQQQRPPPTLQAAAAPDPFEPTPLKTMIQRQQQKAAAQAAAAASKQQQQQQGTSSMRSPSHMAPPEVPLRSNVSTSSASSQATSTASTTVASNITDRARQDRDREREAKHRKERFLMFTRVLMKYLEQKDPDMHLKAKVVIRECAEKNKNKEPGFESVTASMQARLRAMVGDSYWTRAEQYLEHFLKQKKLEQAKKATSSSSSSQSQSSSSQARPSSSSQPPQKTAEQLANERQSQMAAFQQKKLADMQREQEKARQQAEFQKRQAAAAAAAEKLKLEQRKEQHRKEAIARMAAKNAAEQQAKKAKKDHKRKGSGSSAAAAAAAAQAARMSPMPLQKAEAPPREYNDLMQLVGHAVDYDWTSAPLLLGKEAKIDVNLNAEQKRLIYGSRLVPPPQGIEAAQIAQFSSELPASMRGWGNRNVLSSRGAWARVRLREQRDQLSQGGKRQPPVVGGLRLPTAPQMTPEETPVVAPEAQWFNEEKAEEDKTLALMSEATQTYLKAILQKSIVAARQRENLDGIRLWHLQHGPSKPPMSLRLGCDVNRQVAQAEGNAARTVQRMEEALERQTHVPAKARELDNDETLYNACSMSDLALRPLLANAAEEAEVNAKRSFQVYGGKETTETAPFGRVPKMPKITEKDLILAREWSDYSHQRKGIATPKIM